MMPILAFRPSTRFAWKINGNAKPVEYEITLSEDSVFTSSYFILKGITDTVLSIWNLKINTTYFWKVNATDADGHFFSSPAFSFTTPDAWPRMIYIDGTTNVRDIGGRRNMDGVMIKQGVFYRSAEFNQTFNITSMGIEQLKSLGIVCEIDLRNVFENPLPLPIPLIRYFRPTTNGDDGILDYEYGLINTASMYRDVFREIAKSENYPMICHCRLGADRTGTVAALLEAILGCSEQHIDEDYIWTSLSVSGVRDTASPEWRGMMSYLKSFDRKDSTIQAGAWNYLREQGVTVDELISIRKIFLGDDSLPYFADISRIRSSSHRLFPRYGIRQCFINSFPYRINSAEIKSVFSISGRKIGKFPSEKKRRGRNALPSSSIPRGVVIIMDK